MTQQVTAVPDEVRQHYVGVIDALARAGRDELAGQCARLAAQQGIWADPLQRPTEYVADGSSQPVYDPAGFWFAQHLSANYERIRAEVDAVTDPASQGFLPVEEPLLSAGRWDQVTLYDAGRRNEPACARFPVTAEVIEQVPEATTLGPGVVTLSWLHPGAHIIPHCGRTNAQLRVHLGVRVPDGTGIRVGREQLSWQEGNCLVFDDSFEHEVWHRGSQPRVVLLMDVLYPELSSRQRERVLRRRRSAAEQITQYLTAHGIRRAELDGQGAVLRPTPEADSMVRRYLAEVSASAVEVRGGQARFERPNGGNRAVAAPSG
jgi:aspartyl/asparaginyl beta-hydroxylase (cupin superfamily)